MTVFQVVGRCVADPPPADWLAQLTARLKAKPRRIGVWAELGLYGALECLANAGEVSLPMGASVILSSQHGPVTAYCNAMEQAVDDLPMPVTVLQTQPSQLLATLAANLGWVGDARFIAHNDPDGLLKLAAAQCNPDGVLLGWVEETGAGRSVWLRLIPCAESAGSLVGVGSIKNYLRTVAYLRVSSTEVSVLLGAPCQPVAVDIGVF